MSMNERQQKVMANIINISAYIIAKSEESDRKFLLDVLHEGNRWQFVSNAYSLALASQDRNVGPAVEYEPKELYDALDPRKNWLKEEEFIQSVVSAVEMKLTTHAAAVKTYKEGLNKLADDKRKKRMGL